MKCRLNKFLLITYGHFISFFFCKKKIFYSEIFNIYIISTGLIVSKYMQRCIQNPVKHLWWSFFAQITKKVYGRSSMWVLNTPLEIVLQQEKFTQNVNISLILSKSTLKICNDLLVLRINKKNVSLTKKLQFVFRFFVAATNFVLL